MRLGWPCARCRCKQAWRSGLTLLELVVVLAILAALSTVAVQSLAQSMDQTRFEITQRLLADIRTACVGDTASSTNSADSIRGSWPMSVGCQRRSTNCSSTATTYHRLPSPRPQPPVSRTMMCSRRVVGVALCQIADRRDEPA